MNRKIRLITKLFYAWYDTIVAVKEMVRYLDERGNHAYHTSTEGICEWWFERSATLVDGVSSHPSAGQEQIRFTVKTERAEGVIVRLPVGESYISGITLDGLEVDGELRQLNGKPCVGEIALAWFGGAHALCNEINQYWSQLLVGDNPVNMSQVSKKLGKLVLFSKSRDIRRYRLYTHQD